MSDGAGRPAVAVQPEGIGALARAGNGRSRAAGDGDGAVSSLGDGPASSRRGLENLGSPCSLLGLLPPVYHRPDPSEPDGPPFAVRMCAGLDEVLAPVVVTLDCIDEYFDPRLAPPDFVTWLAQWLGLALDQNWPEAKQRALLRAAGELYRWEGTVRGIGAYVRLLAGVEPEVLDNGAVAWSAEPGGALPGADSGGLVVRLAVQSGAVPDMSRVEAVIAAAKPANVPHRIELVPVETTGTDGPESGNSGDGADDVGDRPEVEDQEQPDRTVNEDGTFVEPPGANEDGG